MTLDEQPDALAGMLAFAQEEQAFWRAKWEAGDITEEEYLEHLAALQETAAGVQALLGEDDG